MIVRYCNTFLASIFKIDFRALAVMRICLGLIVLADVFQRSFDILDLYSDVGLLPRIPAASYLISKYYFSIHLINGLPEVQLLLFATHAFIGLLLTIGYRTRLMTFLAWVFVTSLNNRMLMVSTGGDTLLRLLLFWSMFLPLDRAYSFRRKRGKSKLQPGFTCSMATVALLLQVLMVYFFTAIMKGPAWYDGTAVYLALNIDLMASEPAYWIRENKELLRYLTYGTLSFEAFGPLLLLQPIPIVRLIGVLLFVGMHVNFGLFLALGFFPLISITSLIPFLPKLFWDRFDRFLEKWVFPTVQSIDIRLRNFPKKLYLKYSLTTPKLERTRPTIPTQAVILFFFLIAVAFNYGALKGKSTPLPDSIRRMGLFLKLNQSWGMFVNPLRGDGWYIITGLLRNGTEVDLWDNKGGPVSYEKPARVNKLFPNYRWRKYFMNLRKKKFKKTKKYLGRWLCRRWNDAHEERLKSLQIFYMREETLINKTRFPIKKYTVMRYKCS